MKTLIHRTSRRLYDPSLGIFFIRLMVGLIFLTHGWNKVVALSQTMAMFSNLGMWPLVGVFIGWLEVIGGLALILGFATRFFGVIFAIEMIAAALLVGAARGFSGMEFELLLAACSLGIVFIGSGKYSVYKMERHLNPDVG
ncbi:MAG: putative oxidoreductase [Parcubacteria bacterium C7867-007]|nr:MAG: putative oxidoreductase [Parcubacteria bacterium C7867-007]